MLPLLEQVFVIGEKLILFLPLISSIVLGIVLLLVLKRHSEMMNVYGEGTKAKYKIKKQAIEAQTKASEIIKLAREKSKGEVEAIKEKAEKKYSDWFVSQKSTARRELFSELDKEVKEKKEEELAKIKEYKKDMENEIKESAANTLSLVLKDALSKSLSVKDHENLVMNALEKAKKQKVV